MTISDPQLLAAFCFVLALYTLLGCVRLVLVIRNELRARSQHDESSQLREESRKRIAVSSARTEQFQDRSDALMARSERNQERWEQALARLEGLADTLQRRGSA